MRKLKTGNGISVLFLFLVLRCVTSSSRISWDAKKQQNRRPTWNDYIIAVNVGLSHVNFAQFCLLYTAKITALKTELSPGLGATCFCRYAGFSLFFTVSPFSFFSGNKLKIIRRGPQTIIFRVRGFGENASIVGKDLIRRVKQTQVIQFQLRLKEPQKATNNTLARRCIISILSALFVYFL